MRKISDFRSDTVTRPTEEMRKAMFTAEVGDDVWGDDPTVKKLEQISAELLGKDEALFVPSGTMGNQIALRLHTHPGEEVLLSESSHIVQHEVGGLGINAGLQAITLQSEMGYIDLAEIERRIRPEDVHFPKTSLICIENPHNDDGGVVLSLDYLEKLWALAQKCSLKVHMDGARIFNAAEYLKTPATQIARFAHTVMFCLSKGLAAPVGSILAGDKDSMRDDSVLIHKCDYNGMFRFESIPTNDECGVPFVVRKRRERNKLTKDDIPFGLKLFFCLLRFSLLTYRCGYAAFLVPRIRNKIASAIVTAFMNQITVRVRKQMGGGMRQSGILAAAGLISLEKMISRLGEDHEMARKFGEFIASLGEPFRLTPAEVHSNMVYFYVPDNMKLIAFLEERGVLIIPHWDRIRVTFHNDIDPDDLERLFEGINEYRQAHLV